MNEIQEIWQVKWSQRGLTFRCYFSSKERALEAVRDWGKGRRKGGRFRIVREDVGRFAGEILVEVESGGMVRIAVVRRILDNGGWLGTVG